MLTSSFWILRFTLTQVVSLLRLLRWVLSLSLLLLVSAFVRKTLVWWLLLTVTYMLLRLLWVLTRLKLWKLSARQKHIPDHLWLSLTLRVSTTVWKPVWVRARKKKKRLLSAVTGTCGVTTLLWKKKARIRSNWIAKNLTGKTSKVSWRVKFVTLL